MSFCILVMHRTFIESLAFRFLLQKCNKFGILGIFLFFVGGINLTTSAEATGQNELVQQTSCVSGLMQEAEDGVMENDDDDEEEAG